MAEAIQCGKCGKRYKFKPQLAGKAIKCPACGGVIRVPEEPKPAAPVVEAVLADTLSFVDEELAASAAEQDELKLAASAPAAAWRSPSAAPAAPINPYQSTYVPRRPRHRERWDPRSGDPPIIKILAIVVAAVVTLFCWGGALMVLL